jgi:hypothetical protein
MVWRAEWVTRTGSRLSAEGRWSEAEFETIGLGEKRLEQRVKRLASEVGLSDRGGPPADRVVVNPGYHSRGGRCLAPVLVASGQSHRASRPGDHVPSSRGGGCLTDPFLCKTDRRSTAIANCLFNATGVLLYFPSLRLFARAMVDLADDSGIAVAWVHLMFNLAVVLVFFVALDSVEPCPRRWLAAHINEPQKIKGEAYEHISSHRV